MKIKNKGFTLVELVVSIAVIGILVGLVLTIVNPLAQFQKADDAKRKADLSEVQKALEQYYQDFGHYPVSSQYKIVGVNSQLVNWGSSWQPYMNLLPMDPTSGRTYAYITDSTQQTYWLFASLERSNDAQACNKGKVCTNAAGLINPCGNGVVCNYGLSSPNTTP